MNPLLLLVLSDLHINSAYGLCPRSFQLDDGGTYYMNPTQSWLLSKYEAMIEKIKKEKELSGSDLFVVFNGDLVEGRLNYGPAQNITQNSATELRMALDVIDPLVSISDKTFIIRGTEVHNGKSNSQEEVIAKDIDAESYNKDVASWWHLIADFRGFKFDITHHTTLGRRPWTTGNGAVRLAAETMYQYQARKERVPDFVIRSHVHQFSDSGFTYPVRAMTTGCWKYTDSYIHKIAPGTVPQIGAIKFFISGGKCDVEAIKYMPKQRTVWKEFTD